MNLHPPSNLTDQMLSRVCGEYLEMPGLRLTQKQAQRLWGMDEATCRQILEFLVEVKFLRMSDVGSYARSAEGIVAVPHLRMAKATLRHGSAANERGARW